MHLKLCRNLFEFFYLVSFMHIYAISIHRVFPFAQPIFQAFLALSNSFIMLFVYHENQNP